MTNEDQFKQLERRIHDLMDRTEILEQRERKLRIAPGRLFSPQVLEPIGESDCGDPPGNHVPRQCIPDCCSSRTV
jgi:hypothetical protein